MNRNVFTLNEVLDMWVDCRDQQETTAKHNTEDTPPPTAYKVMRRMTLPTREVDETLFEIVAKDAKHAIAQAHAMHVPHSSLYLTCKFEVE
jgi:hypothetical protein